VLVLMGLAGVRPLIQGAGSFVSGPYAQRAVSGILLTNLAAALLAPVLLPTCLQGSIIALPEHPADCSCLTQSHTLCSVSVSEM
jgi:hypothetical protein